MKIQEPQLDWNDLNFAYFKKQAGIDKIIILSLSILCILDSFNLWGNAPAGQKIIDSLKIFNGLLLPLIFIRYKPDYKTLQKAFLVLFFSWMYLFESNLVTGLMKAFARIISLIFTFILLPNNYKLIITKIWVKYVVYMFVPAIAISIILNFTPISLPSFTYEKSFNHNAAATELLTADWQKSIYNCYFGVAYYGVEDLSFRLQGVFDEPGMAGTIAGWILFLFSDKLSKKEVFIVAFAGILTWSLFFILTIPLILIKQLIKKKNYLQFSIYAILLTIFFTYCVSQFDRMLNSTNRIEQLISQRIFNRLLSESGGVEVDTERDVKAMRDLYDEMWAKGGTALFMGNNFAQGGRKYDIFGLSLKIFMYDYGLLFTIYFFTLMAMFLPWRKSFFISALMFGFLYISHNQRPQTFRLEYFSLFYAAILFEKQRKNQLLANQVLPE